MQVGIPWLERIGITEVTRQTFRQARDDDVLTYAASLAFHIFLALFPFLVFLFALVSFLGHPQLLEGVLNWAGTVVPEEAMNQVNALAQETLDTGNAGLLSVGVAGAVWAASGGIRSAMTVLNRAFDVPRPRAIWKRYLLSIVYTLALGILLLVGAALIILGPSVASRLLEKIGVGAVSTRWLTLLQYPVAVMLLILATDIAYSFLPNLNRFRWISPGAVMAVLSWIGLSVGFRLYVTNFGRFNVLYGSLGAVIVLLLYLWISSIVLLVGGELNAALERKRPRIEPS